MGWCLGSAKCWVCICEHGTKQAEEDKLDPVVVGGVTRVGWGGGGLHRTRADAGGVGCMGGLVGAVWMVQVFV